jgi:hypothetical protein
MKAIEKNLAFALAFAALAIITIFIGQYGKNPYFIVAAAAFAVATYVTYPPRWAVELGRLWAEKRAAARNARNERK